MVKDVGELEKMDGVEKSTQNIEEVFKVSDNF